MANHRGPLVAVPLDSTTVHIAANLEYVLVRFRYSASSLMESDPRLISGSPLNLMALLGVTCGTIYHSLMLFGHTDGISVHQRKAVTPLFDVIIAPMVS